MPQRARDVMSTEAIAAPDNASAGPDLISRPPTRPAGHGDGLTGDIVDEWGRQSFPASDPPANW